MRSALVSLASNDAAAALHMLEEAADADPDNGMVFCLMGDAQRLGGRGLEAVQSYQNAMRLAGQDARIEARARIGIARTLEMDPAKRTEAREAWIAYVRFADTHADVASSEVGRARVQAIDLVMEQEAAYPEVRQRIAARAAAQQATR